MIAAATAGSGPAQAGVLDILNGDFGSGLTEAFPGADNWDIGTGPSLNEFYTTDGTGQGGAFLSEVDPFEGQAGFGDRFLTANRLAGFIGEGEDDEMNPAVSMARQLVSIPASDHALIDAGEAQINLDFFYNMSVAETASINVEFFSDLAGVSSLGSVSTGGLSATPAIDWRAASLIDLVPANARSLRIELNASRTSGTATNVHFDEISGLIETALPPALEYPFRPLTIANPGFEDDDVTATGGVAGASSWTLGGNSQWYTSNGDNHADVGDISEPDPDAGQGGSEQYLAGNRFAIVPDDPTATETTGTLRQLVDISSASDLIDEGDGRVKLDFYYNQWDAAGPFGPPLTPENVGELPSSGDLVRVNYEFFSDTEGTESLGVVSGDLLPITDVDAWEFGSAIGQAPVGARSVAIELSGERTGSGSALNVGIDSLSFFVSAETLFGDYNDDGAVDAADFTVWRDNLGTNTVLPNDSTPGVVTEEDYAVWRTNYNASIPSGSASQAVPEPNGLLLAASLGALVLLGLGGRTRGSWGAVAAHAADGPRRGGPQHRTAGSRRC
ncbi:hypothetical protein [Pseudobythopirellula maris]|uniref:hypothetical protein n=1 Tax=Pseudobythopirellula maris TaxID=2527991 RepID=UPI0018D34163|nr:hypothetical protein [Pseudobythopirellula maris]